jgi:ParB family chromosome partitioning protein
MPGHDIRVETIRLTDIYSVGERRPVDPAAVEKLAASIESLGLRHPITVRYVTDIMLPDDDEPMAGFRLIAGGHRLAAYKLLGRESIDCIVVRCSETEARKWEIAENLHRSDLTELQRKQQIAEWIAITEQELLDGVSAQVAPKPLGGRPRSGINAASRELGIERTEAQRAVKIGSISERAREAAVAAKLDNNQSALLKIASVTPDKQVERVRELAAARDARRKPEPPSDAPRNDYELINKQHRALVRAWEAARPEARDQFLADIGASLDGIPVMDRGAA